MPSTTKSTKNNHNEKTTSAAKQEDKNLPANVFPTMYSIFAPWMDPVDGPYFRFVVIESIIFWLQSIQMALTLCSHYLHHNVKMRKKRRQENKYIFRKKKKGKTEKSALFACERYKIWISCVRASVVSRFTIHRTRIRIFIYLFEWVLKRREREAEKRRLISHRKFSEVEKICERIFLTQAPTLTTYFPVCFPVFPLRCNWTIE